MFLLRLGLRPWRLAPFSQLFSAMAVGFLLLLAGFLFWLQAGLRPVVARLHGEQVITAYLDSSVAPGAEGKVVDAIRVSLGAPERGAPPEIRFVSASQFVTELKVAYPELAREIEALGPDADPIVPRYVSISGMLSDSALGRVKKVAGIDSAESSKDRFRHVVGAFSALRWVARLLMIGLCLALVTGLIHLAKMNAYLHRDSLALMKLWGAGAAMLRIPGLISGALVGIGGGALAVGGWFILGDWLASHIRALSPILHEMPTPPAPLPVILLFSGCFLGVLAGLLGSMVSTTNPETRA